MMFYNILEIANTHGGNINYVLSMIDELKSFPGGIKFQPFKYDLISEPDYPWHETYKQLFFSQDQWGLIIDTAAETKDIWLDMFDSYSVETLRQNQEVVKGVKFQSSTLNNIRLMSEISSLDLSNKIILVNVAAHYIEEIREIVLRIEKDLSPGEIVLQVGFQAYPTELSDSGIAKISLLKAHFTNRLSFADHISAEAEDSIYLPAIATAFGCNIIEKHVKHSAMETKFDGYSSIDAAAYKKFQDTQLRYANAMDQPFINDRERSYLKHSIQAPILAVPLSGGRLLNIDSDLDFRRTAKTGMSLSEIRETVQDFHMVRNDKNAGETLNKEDFKKAVIATIIACRMKSTRLPQKAILKIGNISSIELCLKNALKFRNVNHTILATSTVEEDEVLKDYTYSKSVVFHKGDPDDVIRRYLDVVDQLKIDVVIRVTGDMPYVSDDILQILLKSHFESGADYTSAREAAVGTNLEIINSSALRKVKDYFPSANYSEYMTYYFTNNPSFFRLNYVELPSDLIRPFRLTLDYQQDLDMFEKIENHFTTEKLTYNIRDLYKFMDNNHEISNMNKTCELKYKTDQSLIELLRKETTIK